MDGYKNAYFKNLTIKDYVSLAKFEKLSPDSQKKVIELIRKLKNENK